MSYRFLTYGKRVAGNKEEWMRYICLGYIEPGKFEGMTEDASTGNVR